MYRVLPGKLSPERAPDRGSPESAPGGSAGRSDRSSREHSRKRKTNPGQALGHGSDLKAAQDGNPMSWRAIQKVGDKQQRKLASVVKGRDLNPERFDLVLGDRLPRHLSRRRDPADQASSSIGDTGVILRREDAEGPPKPERTYSGGPSRSAALRVTPVVVRSGQSAQSRLGDAAPS